MTANEILEGIDQWIHEQAKNEKRRGYLGASSAGADCLRALWYSWRFCGQETFNSRMLRLFRRGHREEAWFVEMLRGMGAEVWDVNPATGEQWEISDFAGHFRGHADGVARFPDGMVALLEFKTYNDKRFQNLQSIGVRNESRKYYVQMQIYMHHLNLSQAVFMAVNKNTDDLYVEIVDYDKVEFDRAVSRISSVLNSSAPPQKVSDDPTCFSCRFCTYNPICHMAVPPVPHCRNCVYAEPVEDGKWQCRRGYEFGTTCADYTDITRNPTLRHEM